MYFTPQFINTKNIPYQKGVIFVSNHLSYLDQFSILPGIKKRPIDFLVAKELLEMKRGYLYKHTGCVFIDRKSLLGSLHSLTILGKILSNGSDIFIFPEGTRNNGYKKEKCLLLEMQDRPILLARATSAPIVPIAITDNYEFTSKKLLVRFGEPFIVGVDDEVEEKRLHMYNSILDLVLKNS